MERKNIFQFVAENYDIQNEIKKINELFFEETYFCVDSFYKRTFEKILEGYLFTNWKWRDTCITVKDFFRRANAYINYRNKQIIEAEDVIINNIEVIENFLKLYYNNSDELADVEHVKHYVELDDVFYDLVQKIESRMGLVAKNFKDRVILFPKNAPLEKVVDICNEEDVQWELIRYTRENLSLAEKRKSLAYLATNLYIEQDKTETNTMLVELLSQATNVLNNLHIRHNNKTGKWEKNEVLKNISDKEAKQLCDFVYNKMLMIVLLRENSKYEATYQKFNNMQKGMEQNNG